MRGISDLDCLKNGKRSLALNLKDKKGIEILKKLTAKSDVLIEPFRSGVMESLGLGPQTLQDINPRLIYARLTGFGQSGPYASMAGHDINYVATSGVLSFLGRKNEKPTPPVNLLADFGGGGLTCALGIILALFEREKSGKGQVIDCSMVEGTAYLSSWLFRSQQLPIWGNERGNNVLDTGSHFYDTYETSDGKYMAVGALENQFYDILVEKLNTDGLSEQWNDFEWKKKILKAVFKTKTREEWCKIFDGTDACVTPVLEHNEAPNHPHNKERESFIRLENGIVAPKPAPKLNRTPGVSMADVPDVENGADTEDILLELGYTKNDIEQLNKEQVVKIIPKKSKL